MALLTLKPYVYLDWIDSTSSKMYFKVRSSNTNQNLIPGTTQMSEAGNIRTYFYRTVNVGPGANPGYWEMSRLLDSSTGFDPSTIDFIKVEIDDNGTTSEGSTISSEGDASGDHRGERHFD